MPVLRRTRQGEAISARASRDEVIPQGAGRGVRLVCAEVALAVIAFAALCVVVLSVAPRPEEPDDGAYRASIVAMTEGHFLTLSGAQVDALAARLDDRPGQP